jgi:hypothetical protein
MASKYPVNKSVMAMQQIFPEGILSFHYVPGEENVADGLSRGAELGRTNEEATAEVRRIVLGFSPTGVPTK